MVKITSNDLLSSPRALEMVVEFLNEVAEQIPEKPDYWNSCGQCDRNINTVEDIIFEAQVEWRKKNELSTM